MESTIVNSKTIKSASTKNMISTMYEDNWLMLFQTKIWSTSCL